MSKLYKFINVNDEKKKISHFMDDIFKINEKLEDCNAVQNADDHDEDIVITESEMKIRRLISDAREEAANIVQHAEIQAVKLVEEEKVNINKWWDDKRAEDADVIENIKNVGYNEGFSEGKIAAEIEVKEEYLLTLKQAQMILEEAYEIKEQIIQEAELAIVEISIKIAEKIIIKEMEADKSIIELITMEALKNIKEFDRISIYVNPEHYPFVQTARGDLLSVLNGQVELMIYPDASIISGGCIIKTSTGALDAMVDTQLAEIKQALLNTIGSVVK